MSGLRGIAPSNPTVYIATPMTGALLAISYTALLLYMMRLVPFYASVPGLRMSHVGMLFILKILAGTALWGIYTYVYPDRYTADVFKYFDDSAHMFKALPAHPVDYLRMLFGVGNDTPEFLSKYYLEMNNWERAYESNLYNDSHTIIRFNAVVRLVSFGEFHVHTVMTAFLSLTGMLAIYRTFIGFLPNLGTALAGVIFLLPSVLLWASGVIKESLLYFGLGLMIYEASRLLNGRWKWWEPIVLICAMVMLFLLKFYVLMSLLPALAFLAWAKRGSSKNSWWKAIVVYGLFVGVGLNLHHVLPGWNILGILTMKQRDFVGLAMLTNSGSFVMPQLLLPEIQLFVSQLPYAIFITLFGPMVHVGEGSLSWIAAIENAVIVLMLILCIRYRRPWHQMDGALIAALLLYILLLGAVIGWTTPVMGAIVRYRTPLLPFLLIVGLLFVDRDRVIRSWKTLRNRFA